MDDKKWLSLLCLAETGTMLVLLNYSAVLPLVQAEWGLTNTQAGLIYSSYQVGYILLVVVLSTLTDYVDAKIIYVVSALWAGLSGILFALYAQGFYSALVFRCLTGIGLAGTYMPGLKMVSLRFAGPVRGKAVGVYVGAFSIGTSLSMFLAGVLIRYFHWRTAMFATSLGPIAGAMLAWLVLDPMPPAGETRAGWGEVKKHVFNNQPALLAMAGYMAHMWEMFGMRGWMVAFFTASIVSGGGVKAAAASSGAQLSALMILAGGLATAFAGTLSDRLGRVRTIQLVMLGSACCSFTIGWLRPLPVGAVLLASLVYGVFTTAESSVLSTAVTEYVPAHCLGAAMALQSFLGWAAAGVSPVIFGYILDLSNPAQEALRLGYAANWGPAFVMLGLGALVGPAAVSLIKKGEMDRRKGVSSGSWT